MKRWIGMIVLIVLALQVMPRVSAAPQQQQAEARRQETGLPWAYGFATPAPAAAPAGGRGGAGGGAAAGGAAGGAGRGGAAGAAAAPAAPAAPAEDEDAIR